MHNIKKKNRLSQNMMRWFLLIVLLPTLALSLLIFVMVYQHSYETRISDKRTVLSVIADGVESNANLVMHVVDTTCYDANIENLLSNSHLQRIQSSNHPAFFGSRNTGEEQNAAFQSAWRNLCLC